MRHGHRCDGGVTLRAANDGEVRNGKIKSRPFPSSLTDVLRRHSLHVCTHSDGSSTRSSRTIYSLAGAMSAKRQATTSGAMPRKRKTSAARMYAGRKRAHRFIHARHTQEQARNWKDKAEPYARAGKESTYANTLKPTRQKHRAGTHLGGEGGGGGGGACTPTSASRLTNKIQSQHSCGGEGEDVRRRGWIRVGRETAPRPLSTFRRQSFASQPVHPWARSVCWCVFCSYSAPNRSVPLRLHFITSKSASVQTIRRFSTQPTDRHLPQLPFAVVRKNRGHQD